MLLKWAAVYFEKIGDYGRTNLRSLNFCKREKAQMVMAVKTACKSGLNMINIPFHKSSMSLPLFVLSVWWLMFMVRAFGMWWYVMYLIPLASWIWYVIYLVICNVSDIAPFASWIFATSCSYFPLETLTVTCCIDDCYLKESRKICGQCFNLCGGLISKSHVMVVWLMEYVKEVGLIVWMTIWMSPSVKNQSVINVFGVDWNVWFQRHFI